MAEGSSYTKELGELLTRFPDITVDILQAVLEANNFSYDRTYEVLCEMAVPADQKLPASTITEGSPVTSRSSAADPSENSLVFEEDNGVPDVVRISRQVCTSRQAKDVRGPDAAPKTAPTPVDAPRALQGAWALRGTGNGGVGAAASLTVAAQMRVDAICARYPWAERSVVIDLYASCGECDEVVEGILLDMFPIDDISGYLGPDAHSDARPLLQKSSFASSQISDSPKSDEPLDDGWVVVSEARRRRDIAEMTGFASLESEAARARRQLIDLRIKVPEEREKHLRLNALASQTRQREHFEAAKTCAERLEEMSTELLNSIRASPEYAEGHLDLHGLTTKEAIELVDGKLSEMSAGRVEIVTGKGNHSVRGQPILRPAIEKYLKQKGMSYSLGHGNGAIHVRIVKGKNPSNTI